MQTELDYTLVQDLLRDYIEGALPDDLRGQVARKIATCPKCREAYQRRLELVGLMDHTFNEMSLNPEFDQRASERLSDIDQHMERLSTPGLGQQSLPPEQVTVDKVPLPWAERQAHAAAGEDFADDAGYENEESYEGEEAKPGMAARFAPMLAPMQEALRGAPWWVVSGAFHGLLLLLITLVGMAVMKAQTEDTIIVARLEQVPEKQEDQKERVRDVFNKTVITPTDLPATETQVVTHEEVEVADFVETPDDSDFADAKGDEEAVSDVPLGGVGTVAAMGLGGGRGGAFGRPTNAGGRARRARINGGGKATESAVDKGLEWLARNQEPDGKWDHAKHGGKHAGINGDAAMTGYALLAFLGAGHTEKIGKYKDNVRNAVKWLIDNQGLAANNGRRQHEGRWSPNNYTQGIASMAICEAAAMGRIPATKEAAQKAVDGIEWGQIARDEQGSEREAWDYAPKGKSNDSSVMAWNVLALKSAKVAGLRVDPAAFEGAITWINAGQDLGGFKPGDEVDDYDWEGGRMAYRGTPDTVVKGKGSVAVMAAAALCRMQIEGRALNTPGVLGPCNLMLKQLPRPERFNRYYGYYATLAMFQRGGEHWKQWNESMKPALLETQVKGGKDDGSWDPDKRAGHCDEGRVMSTALSILCLEVYYRYLPIYKDAAQPK